MVTGTRSSRIMPADGRRVAIEPALPRRIAQDRGRAVRPAGELVVSRREHAAEQRVDTQRREVAAAHEQAIDEFLRIADGERGLAAAVADGEHAVEQLSMSGDRIE